MQNKRLGWVFVMALGFLVLSVAPGPASQLLPPQPSVVTLTYVDQQGYGTLRLDYVGLDPNTGSRLLNASLYQNGWFWNGSGSEDLGGKLTLALSSYGQTYYFVAQRPSFYPTYGSYHSLGAAQFQYWFSLR